MCVKDKCIIEQFSVAVCRFFSICLYIFTTKIHDGTMDNGYKTPMALSWVNLYLYLLTCSRLTMSYICNRISKQKHCHIYI